MSAHLPTIDKGRSRTYVDQLIGHFHETILSGRLGPGDRLPTIRAVAEHTDITRTTVQEAYRRLAQAGLVSATVGRGTVVLGEPGSSRVRPFSAAAQAAWHHFREAPQAPQAPSDASTVINFAQLQPDPRQFPVDEFRRCIEAAMRDRGGDLLEYGQAGGLPELRRRLAAREAPQQEPSSLDEILITNGAQQGIDLALRTFTESGDAIAVTIPTYQHLFGLLRVHGLEIIPISEDENGIDLADLRRVLTHPRVRLIYAMPSFHNPTGRSLGVGQREALTRAVSETDIPILEDEFEHELRFAGEDLPTLRSFDGRGLTVTARTFSKGLFPGVRIGWLRAEPKIIERMAALKCYSDLETSPLLQAALANFMDSGSYDGHLSKLREELRHRHRAAQVALKEHMPEGFRWSEPSGGHVLWVEGPNSIDDDAWAALAAKRGILVTPGRVFDPFARPRHGIRLSLSAVSTEQIHHGIEMIGQCASELLARPLPSRRPLFL